MQKRKTYSREFKLEAVRLLERGDRPAADIARELGIDRTPESVPPLMWES